MVRVIARAVGWAAALAGRLIPALALAACLWPSQPAAAQETPADPAMQQKVDELLRLLADPELRAALAAAGPGLAATAPRPVDLTPMQGAALDFEAALDLWVAQIKAHVWSILQAAQDLPEDLALAGVAASAMVDRAGWTRLALSLAVVLACAFAVEAACRWMLAHGHGAQVPQAGAAPPEGAPGEGANEGPNEAPATMPPPAAWPDVPHTAAPVPAPVPPPSPAMRHGERITADILPLFAFVMGVVVVYLLLRWPPPLGPLVQPWLIALMLVRLVRWVVRLSFRLPDASVLPGAAAFWLGRMTLLTAIFAFGWALTRSLAILSAPVDTVVLLRYVTGLVLIVLTVATLWHHPTTPERHAALGTRRLFLTVWLVLIAVLEVMGTFILFWLAIYAVALPPLLRQVTRLVRGVMGSSATTGAASLRLVLVDRGMRALVIGAAALWLGWLVRDHPGSAVMREDTLAMLLQGVLRGVIILLMADLAWQTLKAAVEASLLHAAEAADPATLARSARLRTLLPIIRSIAGVAILTVALMMVLAGLGVEIGPLIAGAGVFGVAIGFGSQTLVKDVISGIFYMLDDAFRVGEYIQSGSYKGVVEGFSLRSVRLRHHRGPVFTVPFGTLGAVQNMSRDWSKDKFMITVPYDTDIEKVRKLVKKVGETLLADEEFGDLFIQPMKMKGVEQFGDYGITLGVAMILKPTPLLSMIRRRAYMMIRDSFRQNGIEFASPTVQVAAQGGDDDKAATERAAALALEQRKRAAAAAGEAGAA